MALVLGPGGGGDGAQRTARQGRLEQIGGVALPGLAAGTDQRVRLVDEQDHRLGGRGHLVDDAVQTVLELALDPRTGLEQAKIERANGDPAQGRRDIAARDPKSQPLDDCGLADTRVAHQDRVVLASPQQDIDDLADLDVASVDRVDPAGGRLGGEIDRVGIERRARPVGLAGGPDAVIFRAAVHDPRQVVAQPRAGHHGQRGGGGDRQAA